MELKMSKRRKRRRDKTVGCGGSNTRGGENRISLKNGMKERSVGGNKRKEEKVKQGWKV